jgi:hypothetical protein
MMYQFRLLFERLVSSVPLAVWARRRLECAVEAQLQMVPVYAPAYARRAAIGSPARRILATNCSPFRSEAALTVRVLRIHVATARLVKTIFVKI